MEVAHYCVCAKNLVLVYHLGLLHHTTSAFAFYEEKMYLTAESNHTGPQLSNKNVTCLVCLPGTQIPHVL
jgi:hypothetical protein